MKRRLPPAFYNPITLMGMTFAMVMLLMALFLIVLEVFAGFANGYSGLITYIALPSLMFAGLFVAAIGAVREMKRHKRDGVPDKLPVLDFNLPRQRRTATLVLVAGVGLLALSGFGSYKGYEYTESVQFCGSTCHLVMEPEYTTYQASPHAKVACVGCHIGEGVDHYLQSKLSGTRQLYAAVLNKFERPIKTPVENLRPAKDTCEQCHWPKHFFTQKLKNHEYTLGDEENTPYSVGMLVKIGGGQGSQAQGIHAHMYLNSTVTYVAEDRERQVIPYVEMTDKDGKVTIYRDPTSKMTQSQIDGSKRRIVDCIDCHNRPTHIFKPASVSIDAAISTGQLDRTVPEIKAEGVELLDAAYATREEAQAKIPSEMRKYYQENYADWMKSNTSKLDGAINVLLGIYQQNYFPEMKTDWRSHADNLDHMRGNGCFRCHNNRLVSDTGKRITNDCKTCHTIVAQGRGTATKTDFKGLNFEHPVDVGDDWKTKPCRECHGPQKPK